MKYIVLLGDGMADEPLEELSGKTPLQAAKTPRMDALACCGETGIAHTVPQGYHPGSDVANLSVFGYDPADCYTGRSPLEAASMGVELAPDDVAFRVNLVHLTPHYGKLYMEDFSAGHISTAEAKELIDSLQEEFGGADFRFYPGVSYRHLMVWKGGKDKLRFTPPHDLTQQSVEGHMPKGEGADVLIDLMTSSQLLFNTHAVNRRRAERGELTANSIWMWGHGRKPSMTPLTERFGIRGAVISAVDLIKGIGIYAGLEVINVPGATGYLDTNYHGKAEAALAALTKDNFVYLHVEAPDEAAHGGNVDDKVRAIEDFDAKVVGTVLDGLASSGDEYRVLVLPDHPTPVKKMTHTSDPVPYILFDSQGAFSPTSSVSGYDEFQSRQGGNVIDPGHLLMERLLTR